MKISFSKENVILAVFFAIALAYLVWVVYKTYFIREHFTNTEDLSDYQARMTVMKVFDTVLHRKPVPEEINKYAAITNEQDMLVAVLADFNVVTAPIASSGPASVTSASVASTSAVTSEAVESFSPTVTPAPLPVAVTVAVVQEAATKKPLDLLAIEKSLANITDSVNSIRGLLYTQTICEGS